MNALSAISAAKLSRSTRLNLSCGLTEFPSELFELADTLEILDLSGNHLTSLPEDFSRLYKLRILFCSDNQFSELPAVLGKCSQLTMMGFKANKIRNVPAAALPKSLRWLILTDNQISELPAELGKCTELQKLMLAGNQLQTLPDELAACSKLELLRIAANRFTALPEWLFKLPRLSWLAYAGNPYSEMSESNALQQNPIHNIPWQRLHLQQQLGQGASGVIHQATWQIDTEKTTDVAVKLFKGALTSDGLPYSEKAACISAGAHPNLIAVHGKIINHPSDTKGLVMALIDPSFHNLAAPPSLDSCTRDIYADDTKFTLQAALHMARGIASAAKQLHSLGILHGDLYAHNILHNGQGDCLLGDFGAATFLPLADQTHALALQRIEVRAFGCLLEELIERCVTPTVDQEAIEELKLLQMKCIQENITARPLFSEILSAIGDLQERSL